MNQSDIQILRFDKFHTMIFVDFFEVELLKFYMIPKYFLVGYLLGCKVHNLVVKIFKSEVVQLTT